MQRTIYTFDPTTFIPRIGQRQTFNPTIYIPHIGQWTSTIFILHYFIYNVNKKRLLNHLSSYQAAQIAILL